MKVLTITPKRMHKLIKKRATIYLWSSMMRAYCDTPLDMELTPDCEVWTLALPERSIVYLRYQGPSFKHKIDFALEDLWELKQLKKLSKRLGKEDCLNDL